MAASPNHDQLYQFAEMQAGYFTTAQARTAGFSHALLSYHVQAGRFARLSECPPAETVPGLAARRPLCGVVARATTP